MSTNFGPGLHVAPGRARSEPRNEFPHLVHDAVYDGRMCRGRLTHLRACRLKSRERGARDELVGSRGRMDIIPKKVGVGVAAHGSAHQARVGDVGEAEW